MFKVLSFVCRNLLREDGCVVSDGNEVPSFGSICWVDFGSVYTLQVLLLSYVM